LKIDQANDKRLDTILVLDFGGQYCHLIARRIRELSVYSEVVSHDMTPEEINHLDEKLKIKGLILSGGPTSVFDDGAPRLDVRILSLDLPILGICYGHQLLAFVSGGRVERAKTREYGTTIAIVDKPIGVLKGSNKEETVWMSHADDVITLPEDYEVLAHTDNSPNAAFGHRSKQVYGLQWHPEVTHTKNGMLILRNFALDVCGCSPGWTAGDFVKRSIIQLREIIGQGKAVIGASGGIDSSVTAVLAARAIGSNLTAVFVDHGFMREGERNSVATALKKLGVNLVVVDGTKTFLDRLKGITDPEAKRKIIGEEFVRAFERVAAKVHADYLLQGTIYPDRIESGFRRYSDKIKTHHNVAGLPTKIKFREIVEPLRDLYKDEVRKVAKSLGLPREMVWRQPFPGPGLAVRVVGEVTQEKLDIARAADQIVTQEIERCGLNSSLWQYFAVLTDTKSTGVKGDSRAYGYTVAIRAVESREAMTAMFARIPYDILEKISTRITNEVPKVVRVVYDITHKPPSTIEWE
jgi:GMP synthase (glutamine-hydrolysing)